MHRSPLDGLKAAVRRHASGGAEPSLSKVSAGSDLLNPLKWLTLCRLLFCSFLLGSTILLQVRHSPSLTTTPLLILYWLTSAIFLLSFIYALFLPRVRRLRWFAALQVAVDTLIVSLVILVTGGFFSVFSFLYLIVIVYGTILLGPTAGRFLAFGCTLQYISMVVPGYFGWLLTLSLDAELNQQAISGSVIIYRVSVTTIACFGVAFLSGLLVEKANRSHIKLMAMEDHVRRVDRMAAIGEMAAGLAHEIKNPLASLGGAIQMLKEEIQYEPDHERLMQIVLRETDRLSSLVNNFLMFARPPQGRTEHVALYTAVKETLGLFEKDTAIFGKVKIRKSLATDAWVEIDPVHLKQILWNLLLNAAEAIGEKGVIDVQITSPSDDTACLSIEDNGEGMTQETVDAIFDPFFTTKPNGTGLGLSIVHRILESYQAQLDVHSRLGRGSRFSMRFKAVQAPPKDFHPHH
jgi:two-component system sensor histidine kinase PilS (NtrC family)